MHEKLGWNAAGSEMQVYARRSGILEASYAIHGRPGGEQSQPGGTKKGLDKRDTQ